MKTVIFAISFLTLGLFAMSYTATQNDKYEIASEEYEMLTDKALKHIENFDFDSFYEMLSDDVEYYLPDGDAGTRTAYKGKKEVMDFWDNYLEKSGNTKLIASNLVHVAVDVKKKLKYTNLKGIIVLSYFSLEMHYGKEKTNIRMNWGTHFNEDKKIDRIYTYYDRTPIIEAAKKNMLTKKNQ